MPNQLRADGKLRCTRVAEKGIIQTTESFSDSDDDVPLSSFIRQQNPSARRPRAWKAMRKWRHIDISGNSSSQYQRPDFLDQDCTPVEWFQLFYVDEVIQMFVDYSKKYAVLKGDESFSVTSDEIRLLLDILLLSGYRLYARNHMYWDTGSNTYLSGISNAISRYRFEQILRYLHVSDNNNLHSNDKFTKNRPLWDQLNKSWLKYFPNYFELSVDESMIPYYGHHSTKQYIHGKPIRFGFKNWSLCKRLGYLI